MRYFISILLVLMVSTTAFGATGAAVTYKVDGQSYEGYYISPSNQAPLVLLIHDWDGLTDYEIKRAQHAFTVLGGKRYQETADKASWKRFQEFLADKLK